jgi:uncharacterized protein (TIGR02391 family)
MPTLDDLRTAMSPDQVRIVTLIWDHFLSQGKWIPRRVVHHAFRPNGRAIVHEAMQMLGGSIVYDAWENGEVYRITVLGVVLSERGRAAEELLVKYLSFVRDTYEIDPERDHVSRDEIQSAFELSDGDADLLGELIFFDHFFGVGGTLGRGWRAQFPRDAEDISDDVRAYLHAKLLSTYKPNVSTSSPYRERELFGGVRTVEVPEALADFAENTVGRLRTQFEGLNIHPRIAAACADLYSDGHCADAVFRASIALEEFVQERSGRTDMSGSTLMEHVFSPNGPTLAFNPLADQSDRNEQRGMMLLFLGTVFAFRNPRAHKSAKDRPEEALESIVLISFLAKRLEQAQALKRL